MKRGSCSLSVVRFLERDDCTARNWSSSSAQNWKVARCPSEREQGVRIEGRFVISITVERKNPPYFRLVERVAHVGCSPVSSSTFASASRPSVRKREA